MHGPSSGSDQEVFELSQVESGQGQKAFKFPTGLVKPGQEVFLTSTGWANVILSRPDPRDGTRPVISLDFFAQ